MLPSANTARCMPTPRFEQKDVRDMAVNPTSAVKSILATYPHLQKHFGQTPDAHLRFLAWGYDPYSPLIKRFPDASERVKVAAEMAGLKDDEVSPETVMLWCSTVVRSRTWRLIVTTEAMYEEFEERVRKPIGDVKDEAKEMAAVERKIKLRVELRSIVKDLESMYAELFGDDQATLKAAADALQEYTPEAIAAAKEGAGRRNRKEGDD